MLENENIEQTDKPEGKFKTFMEAIIAFFKCTDFEVSLKNPTLEGVVHKSENTIKIGLGQNGNQTNLEYKDNKVKVSHESIMAKHNNDPEVI